MLELLCLVEKRAREAASQGASGHVHNSPFHVDCFSLSGLNFVSTYNIFCSFASKYEYILHEALKDTRFLAILDG